MEKLISIASAMLCVTALAALDPSATSLSSGVVGYATREFNKDTSIINMLTFQWDTVNGTSRKIGDILKCSVKGTAWNHGTADEVTPGWENTAPMIQIRQASGSYITLYYADDAWDDANQICVEGWAYADGSLGNVDVALGQGCWYESATENATFTVAGEISGTETAVGGETSVILMAGGAFPVAFDPSDATKVTWTCTPGTAWNHGTADNVTPGWENSAPMIQIRQATGSYITLYYADDAWDDANQECVPGWAYADGSLASVTIDVGGGFWMQNPNDEGQMFLKVKNPVK